MIRTTLAQRLALLGASGALAAGGALLPSAAFAAPAPQVAAVHMAPAQQTHPTGNRTTVRIVQETTTRLLPDGRIKVVKTRTVIKTTKNQHGKVVKRVIERTVSVRFLPAPQDD